MLAIFQKQVAHAPQELHSPRAAAQKPSKNPDEILRDFHSAHPSAAFSVSFAGGAALACVSSTPQRYPKIPQIKSNASSSSSLEISNFVPLYAGCSAGWTGSTASSRATWTT